MRNAEVIRQWSILRDLEASRRATIDDLATRTGVSTRTIRRDLEALQAAGFPLFDETHDGKKYWTLEHRAFRRLDETGFTLAEMTALYFSRSPIPYDRGGGAQYFKHIGLYVYRREFLLEYPVLPVGPLEQVEKLEQLRALENGYKIKVAETEYESWGVDTPEDLVRVEQLFGTRGVWPSTSS